MLLELLDPIPAVFGLAYGVTGAAQDAFAIESLTRSLLDYHGELYGRPIEIDFLARLRDIKRFDSVYQLVEQIALDVQETRRVVNQTLSSVHPS